MPLKVKEKLKEKYSKLPKKNQKIVRIALAAIAGIGVVYALFLAYNVYEGTRVIKVSGNIEGDEVRISFRVAGQITELLVDEGYVLKTGDVLARLDKSPIIQQRDEAAAALKLAEYQYKLDHLDYIRAANLYKEGAISAQQRDAARTKSDTDQSEIDRLKASLALAELNLVWADLTSPLNGYVTLKSSLAGENVMVGTPVFTAIDMNSLWVTAYMAEKDLGRVKLGQKARVITDSYPGKTYDGFISFINQQTEFTPKYIQTTEERVKYVYRIKVKVDNASLDLKPGMPADAYIIVK